MTLDPQTPAIGSWCQIGHPANAGILAGAGFSWLAADCEHGEFAEEQIADFCRALRPHGCSPLVRVRENDLLGIRRALDLGAEGVIVPLVDTAEDARRAVEAAYYPPRGVRGLAWQHANQYGLEFERYVANFRPVVVVMIESRIAVENIEAIMTVDGVDACLLGPYDLSGSYGVPGQIGHRQILEAAEKVARMCLRHSKMAGQHIVTPTRENVKFALDQDFRFLALGMDSQFLGQGAREALSMAT